MKSVTSNSLLNRFVPSMPILLHFILYFDDAENHQKCLNIDILDVKKLVMEVEKKAPKIEEKWNVWKNALFWCRLRCMDLTPS